MSATDFAQTLLDAVRLPSGVHARTYGTRAIVLWAAPVTNICGRCNEELPWDQEPFFGENGVFGIDQFPTQHGCGELTCLPSSIVQDLDEDSDVESVKEAAQDLLESLRDRRQAAVESLRAELVEELEAGLRQVLAAVAAGEDADEAIAEVFGSDETTPGLYSGGGDLIAWTYNPTSEDQDGSDLIEATLSDVSTTLVPLINALLTD